MQLHQLLDAGARTTDGDGVIPCLNPTNHPDLWFSETPEGVEAAKALCQPCPLKSLCLEIAVAGHESIGVFGGEYFVNGKIVARKRPRGRPRKDAPPI
ncbi:MAG: WhiB family transcriptional regulator [Tetrasphaera jenkinsii]|jgi:WhiB family redox-sensing transcriptional regulator|uniref:Putative WhiB-family transcriptional regulator n=1 Tax=Nostocoides jenkinsii Ben 74 TaxID=1193518 RepID=A0A077M3B8_9MICO|nr:WhiB family transcriptional regulator [Tetrasphaera jenkinsii]MCI1262688.1 WhiB family transcriptional regulator [Tetrasphaera jenkinsii]CCI51711.1 putative WhiB-family transcriptional regulator [Tetrasphaera jenkinsii Ben 74]